jgi:hypothetical protein
MGAPTSSIFSEIYLQHLEHTTVINILIHFKLVGYFRYVSDILFIYDMQQTNRHEVLDHFNEINPKLQFTLEEEKRTRYTFWTSFPELTIMFNSASVRNPQLRIPSFLVPLVTPVSTS